MDLFDVAARPDRHTDLLDAAESLAPSALICFERGGPAQRARGNRMALEITPSDSGDIGWQIVDVGLLLTRHKERLEPAAQAHLERLLEGALKPWSDREFGRGNVNHPVIATWLWAAAGQALGREDYSRRADERLRRFIHIFSQAGDMSEYNSPTYLGPTLVGLACIGAHAALQSTRLRARLIEEWIWLGMMARWHPPSQQLAGPHSRAYADSTLGFGGISRFLAHAVLEAPVFWDLEMARQYDHNYDAEWAARIAACTFCFPAYLRRVGEAKRLPYEVFSSTDGEDYTVDGKEVYRGGWGSLTTYLAGEYCLGSSERPYVDGGQTEMCIAYWRRAPVVKGYPDVRPLYFRYIANDRLPGQSNHYYAWYGGADRDYSPNLLHQDGRLHVLQHRSKAILLAQPLKRENGRITSLRFDALIPLFAPLDELWLGEQPVALAQLPLLAGWQEPVLIRDGDIYLAFRPLLPTGLGGEDPPLELVVANRHLILSLYNLRAGQARTFPAHVLDHTHNGLVFEIGSAAEWGDFAAFRRHIRQARLEEALRLEEIREVTYQSGGDRLRLVYHPGTQETLAREVNGQALPGGGFRCPDAAQGLAGMLRVGSAALESAPGVPAWLANPPGAGWVTAALPADQPGPFRFETGRGLVHCAAFAAGRVRVCLRDQPEIYLDSLYRAAPVIFEGFAAAPRVFISGREIQLNQTLASKTWELP